MIYIVGFGPGDRKHMTIEAQEAVSRADVIAGYSRYTALLKELYPEKTYVETGTGRYLSLGWLSPSTETATPEMFFLTGDMEREQTQVKGRTAEFYRDDTGNMANVIVWRDEKNDTLLYISGYFDKESLIDMAESVK